jgi:hypothetical protein
VSWNFLPMLGVQPRIGRGFNREEDRPNSIRIAILSDELFNRWLGGVRGTLALARLMRGLLFGVNEADPWVMGGAVLVRAVVAATASWVPARRATRVNPLVALRWE